MGTGAFKALSGDSAAKYVAEEASKASKEAVTEAFTEMSDSERQRVMKALQSVNMSKATPLEAATPAVPSEKKSANPLGLDFSCFGTKSTPIRETARRGMKPHQFLAIKVFIEKHADESGVLRRWVDWNGAPNHKDSLNLYDLVKYVVNPATAPHKCSFVELMTPEGAEDTATPRWFVSHWWGEPVLDFIKCTDEHARVRELGEDACYWVCASAT